MQLVFTHPPSLALVAPQRRAFPRALPTHFPATGNFPPRYFLSRFGSVTLVMLVVGRH
jgi:hypothetical protein